MKSITEYSLIIEEKARLSASLLWDMQKRYYNTRGNKAWSEDQVPNYITTNPFIANAYAEVVAAFVKDSMTNGCLIDPLYILEVGSGSGRFAYLFIKKFLQIADSDSLKNLSFKYVMTDVAESNIDFWQAHEYLKPYVEMGILDFGKLNMESDDSIVLRNSGDKLEKGKIKGPLVVLSNYVFDSIPQDAFSVKDGKLFENLITLKTAHKDFDLNQVNAISKIEYEFSNIELENENYYQEPSIDDILSYYKRNFRDSAFLIPTATINSIRRLISYTESNFMLLTADKGEIHERFMEKNFTQNIAKHGNCFSFNVNYHAISRYFENIGGKVFCSPYSNRWINIAAFTHSISGCDFNDTSLAFKSKIEDFGPEDYYFLLSELCEHVESMDIDKLVSFIRFTQYDPYTFGFYLHKVLAKNLDLDKDYPREDISIMLNNIWDMYFPIGEKYDLAFYFGLFHYNMGNYDEARKYYLYALKFSGKSADTYYNIALTSFRQNYYDEASHYINEAISLEPNEKKYLLFQIMVQSTISSV